MELLILNERRLPHDLISRIGFFFQYFFIFQFWFTGYESSLSELGNRSSVLIASSSSNSSAKNWEMWLMDETRVPNCSVWPSKLLIWVGKNICDDFMVLSGALKRYVTVTTNKITQNLVLNPLLCLPSIEARKLS